MVQRYLEADFRHGYGASPVKKERAIQAIIATLISLLLIDPLESALTKRLAAAGVPDAAVKTVVACGRSALPTIVSRSISEPIWAATQALRVWTGSVQADKILTEIAPQCAGVVDAARGIVAPKA